MWCKSITIELYNKVMDEKQCITRFYKAFSNGDAEGMVACYHDDVVFTDPAFGTLKGLDAKNMWRMLIARGGGNLNVQFSEVQASEGQGSAKWIAEYPYGSQKRKVVNHVTAQFIFKEGKIIAHTDSFNLWKWTQQALGLSGYLLGWSGFMKAKIQSGTNALLKKYTETSV